MRKISSSLAVFVLLAVLGGLTLLAMPQGRDGATAAPQTMNRNIPVQEVLSPQKPQSVQATIKWTNISIPLEAGITSADEVASYINSTNPPTTTNSIVRIARWDAATQALVIRNVGSSFGTSDFPVQVGDWLLVGANENAPLSFAWVGEVPEAGSTTYNLAANGYTGIMLPLDRNDLTTADALGNAIGSATRVARWDAATQAMVIRNVGSAFGPNDYAISIGYPYLVWSTEAKTWP